MRTVKHSWPCFWPTLHNSNVSLNCAQKHSRNFENIHRKVSRVQGPPPPCSASGYATVSEWSCGNNWVRSVWWWDQILATHCGLFDIYTVVGWESANSYPYCSAYVRHSAFYCRPTPVGDAQISISFPVLRQ